MSDHDKQRRGKTGPSYSALDNALHEATDTIERLRGELAAARSATRRMSDDTIRWAEGVIRAPHDQPSERVNVAREILSCVVTETAPIQSGMNNGESSK